MSERAQLICDACEQQADRLGQFYYTMAIGHYTQWLCADCYEYCDRDRVRSTGIWTFDPEAEGER